MWPGQEVAEDVLDFLEFLTLGLEEDRSCLKIGGLSLQ